VGEIVLSDDNIITPYIFAVFVGLSGAILCVCEDCLFLLPGFWIIS